MCRHTASLAHRLTSIHPPLVFLLQCSIACFHRLSPPLCASYLSPCAPPNSLSASHSFGPLRMPLLMSHLCTARCWPWNSYYTVRPPLPPSPCLSLVASLSLFSPSPPDTCALLFLASNLTLHAGFCSICVMTWLCVFVGVFAERGSASEWDSVTTDSECALACWIFECWTPVSRRLPLSSLCSFGAHFDRVWHQHSCVRPSTIFRCDSFPLLRGWAV